MKKKYYPGLILIIFESIVSGVYTPVDLTWIVLRLCVIALYLTCAIVDTKDSKNIIAWIPIATITLSMLSVDNKYKSLEADKLKSLKSDYVTSVKAPAIPTKEDCSIQPKYARPECAKGNKDLQDTYDKSLKEYNKSIKQSENKIETAKVELTFQEQIPILIYVFFICGLSFISFVATPRDEIKQAVNTDLPTVKIDKEEIVRRYFGTHGKTIETYCFENGIATSTFKRWKKNYETAQKKSETKLRLIKKESA